ncbi:VC2046/SO_2500 family protein [Alkalimonas sp. NCh-2]|uniref:VC2046/SO_2500 family protein n=1 Tax=Alkalimonas sp. NCh-2 TaxID=3144846 RepID=UPI0031F5FD28
MLIHEWQIGPEMNLALQRQQPADFRLWRSLLSAAVEEQAAFVLQQPEKSSEKPSLRQSFGLGKPRVFALQPGDIARVAACNHALQQSFIACRLQQALSPLPIVLQDDAKKLDARVADNLDLHSRRRRRQQKEEPVEVDATALYELLQHIKPQAAA